MTHPEIRRGRFVIWVADRLPHWLLAQPERILVNIACAFIGLAALVPQTGSVASGWPKWLDYAWGGWMLVGAIITLIAVYTYNRLMDRIGALMLATGSFFFGLNLILIYGWGRIFTAIIFLGIFVAKTARFFRSAAVQARKNQYLMEILDSGNPPEEELEE